MTDVTKEMVEAFYESWYGNRHNIFASDLIRIRKGLTAALASLKGGVARTCTCHPHDSPPAPCAEKYALTECRAAPSPPADDAGVARHNDEVKSLADAMEALLYDMQDGQCVCGLAKAQARVAYEPFKSDEPGALDGVITLDEAKAIIASTEY